MKLFFQIIFHLIPIIPILLGQSYMTFAALLAVCVPYIKVRKLKAVLALELAKDKTSGSELGDGKVNNTPSASILEINKAISRWGFVTFT